jgi:class 3 adenylate cyclase
MAKPGEGRADGAVAGELRPAPATATTPPAAVSSAVRGDIDRVTLRFRDRDLDAAYRRDFFERNLWNVRAAHALGIVLWIGWGFLISSFLGPYRDTDLAVRYGVLIPVLLVGIGVSFLRSYRRWWEAEVVATLLATALVWTLYVASVHTMPVDYGYVGAILITAFGYTLLRQRFVVVALTGALIIAMYALVAMVPGNLTRLQMVLAAFYLVSFYVLGLFASYALERSTRLLFLRERELGVERARSDALLSNILPQAIIHRLKAQHPGGSRLAEALDEVTVVFVDAVGFTEQAAKTPPDRLVESLDVLFSRLDSLADRFGLEKIKTVGDAYMAVAGAPRPMPEHAVAAAEMALAVLEELAGWTWPSGDPVLVRIGVASGPAVAGVIGQRKFAYDLWGDTVNLASRLETQAEPGRILVSENVASRLDGRFAFGPPQVLELKGKGPTPARFLLGHPSA